MRRALGLILVGALGAGCSGSNTESTQEPPAKQKPTRKHDAAVAVVESPATGYIALADIDVAAPTAPPKVGARAWAVVTRADLKVWVSVITTVTSVTGENAIVGEARWETKTAFVHPIRREVKSGDVYLLVEEYGRVKSVRDGKLLVQQFDKDEPVMESEHPAEFVFAVEPGWSTAAPVSFKDEAGLWRGGTLVHRGEATTYVVGDQPRYGQLVAVPSDKVWLIDAFAKIEKGAQVRALRRDGGIDRFRPAIVTEVHGDYAAYTVMFSDKTESLVSIGRVFVAAN